MQITINCQTPSSSKNKIIEDVEEGELRTWEVRTGNKSGKILTHCANQYEDKSLLVLTPDEESKQLIITLTKWKSADEPDYAVKAIYIGRFTQAVLSHYGEHFTTIELLK